MAAHGAASRWSWRSPTRARDHARRRRCARAARRDRRTGRSDYPNQVNNVLCFPFIFRGALDVGATTINEAMKVAAADAIAGAGARGGRRRRRRLWRRGAVFGPDYIIPKPFDPRLICEIAPAVARRRCESGVATRPIADFAPIAERLNRSSSAPASS
jgi:malate dehydrogenase (oxaloacetate-decarboxylating)(NADP+)